MTPFDLTASSLALVALAGGVGAALRHLLDAAATRRWGVGQVRGILAVNLFGSLLAGLAVGLTAPDSVLRVATVAAMGGFTTFSTAMVQTVTLALQDATVATTARAATHAAATAVGCVAAAALGLAVGGAG